MVILYVTEGETRWIFLPGQRWVQKWLTFIDAVRLYIWFHRFSPGSRCKKGNFVGAERLYYAFHRKCDGTDSWESEKMLWRRKSRANFYQNGWNRFLVCFQKEKSTISSVFGSVAGDGKSGQIFFLWASWFLKELRIGSENRHISI